MGGIRYLAEADVEALAPGPAEAVDLGARALVLLARGRAQLPPKPAVTPRADAFANAMPAYVPDGDLLGLKWIAAYRGNAGTGLAALNALVVLNEGSTGLVRAILGGAWLTGIRTAGVSGACLRALAPPDGHVAITGAGLQARTHVAVCAALGRRDVVVWARRDAAGAALVAWAAEHAPGTRVRIAASAREAVEGAAAVVTAIAMGVPGQHLDAAWLRPDVLLLPLDYATSVGADLADGATLLSDDPDQMRRYRDLGSFPGYRDPDDFSGARLEGPRPPGRVVCQNLGVGTADLLFADATVRAAEAAGRGVLLPR